MNESIALGRIAGIRVGANWSMIVIIWLVVASVATGVLPDVAPGHAAAMYWALAVLTAVLFFASLLAHELAHSVVARRRGVEVEGITLWLFGGVSNLKGEAVTPGAELRITVVGPLTSLVLGLLFGIAAVGMAAAGAPDIAVAVPGWLAVMNVLLAVFNLLPAFPLDGGRVLRAVLWRRSGDRLRATVAAARAGRAFAYLLIALGALELFTTAVLGGVWFVFLGWFLLMAARAEEQDVLTRDVLAGVRVADAMTPDPVVAPDWISVDELLHTYLLTHRCSSFPLRDASGRVSGLITLNRVRHVPANARAMTRVREVALPLDRVPVGVPQEPLSDLVGRMRGVPDRRALVFDGGRLVGIVSPSDIAALVRRSDLRSDVTRGGSLEPREEGPSALGDALSGR